eukprot:TRINITY_DN3965_c0_g1_i3.p1 TRINITY_DN3965_c0_g1~~TRINITY_DN3965_c0_g1_i3.p1  ORF type:complete len:470 (-),score=104.96 TRINITY_DN3965_c0_g1_i3:64-1473(-)
MNSRSMMALIRRTATMGLPAASMAWAGWPRCAGTAASPAPREWGYVTDVEGNLGFWNNYVKISKVLSRDPRTGEVRLKPGAHFVFGGDAVDQGEGDLRFLEEIVALQRRYPERVHLLLGNRDINKMRLSAELSTAHRDKWPLDQHPGVWWISAPPPQEIGTQLIPAMNPNTVANHLKWILAKTMGAGGTFEYRRLELAKLNKNKPFDVGAGITDQQVADSFVESLSEGGNMREYLRNGKLAVQLGSTLFIHGALSNECIGWTPPSATRSTATGLQGWIETMNLWARQQVNQWCITDFSNKSLDPAMTAWANDGGYSHPQPGSDLTQYGMGHLPDLSPNPTVVYNTWIGRASQVLPPPPELTSWLKSEGVMTVVCGHKPVGDLPLPFETSDGVTVLIADTSYSANIRGVTAAKEKDPVSGGWSKRSPVAVTEVYCNCLLYTSDAADEEDSVDLGGRRIIKKKNIKRMGCD